MRSSCSETSPEELEFRGETYITHHNYGSYPCVSNFCKKIQTQENIKVAHTVLAGSPFPDRWSSETITNESQYEEIILQYKRLLEEAEYALANKDELIELLQNQLLKLENLYKESVNKMENYRYQFVVASKELENLRKICAQYKQNNDKLLRDSEVPGLKKGISQLEKENKYLKNVCNELSKKIDVEQQHSKSSVSSGTQSSSIYDPLDNLKDYCIKIEKLLQFQNKKIESLTTKWDDEKEVSVTCTNSCCKCSTNLEEILIDISNKASFHNENLMKLLNENQTIKHAVTNLETEVLASIPNTHSTINDVNSTKRNAKVKKCSCSDKVHVESNGLLENILSKELDIEKIEHEKEEYRVKFEESSRKERYINSELRNKISELNMKVQEVDELKAQATQFQKLLETLKQENEAYLKELRSLAPAKKLEEEQTSQSLRQLKEQLEFKTLENQKLLECEKALRKHVQNLEHKIEEMDREFVSELNKRNVRIASLQDQYSQYKTESEEKIRVLEQKNATFQELVLSKSQEISTLTENLRQLNENLEVAKLRNKKILQGNEKSIGEISTLFKNKENQCHELAQKVNVLENTAPTDGACDYDIDHIRSEFRIVFREVLEVLKNVQQRIANNSCEISVPPTAVEDITFHMHRFNVILGNDDVSGNYTRRSYTIIPNTSSGSHRALPRKGFETKEKILHNLPMVEAKLDDGNTSENERELSNEVSLCPSPFHPTVADNVGDSSFILTMQQMENDLKALKDQLKEATAIEHKAEKQTNKHESPTTQTKNFPGVESREYVDIEITVAVENNGDDKITNTKGSLIPLPIPTCKSNHGECRGRCRKRGTSVPPTQQLDSITDSADNEYICPCSWCVQHRLHSQMTATRPSTKGKDCSATCSKKK
ncbi:hypothetical protein PPYR_11168 [Photinus pyralis]|uniref:Uncharacterized protein n=2 Tax=Photinus pyralis TaxID=7054 RepID=A0A5N4AAM4_PHOPY|nr:interaptin-like isoform X2 [Photinus pyralis]KAB0794329.1 hypothetical protein PPYR_11168 [Photinus pyralis]